MVEMLCCRLCCNSLPNLRSVGRTIMDTIMLIHQGEGGEQGDALMPMLCSLGQHAAVAGCAECTSPRGASVRLLGRHLRRVMFLQGVMHCRWPPSAWIGMPGCGEEVGFQPTIMGSGVGHVEYVQAQLVSTTEKHKTLCQRIQSVQDWQSAWLLLLFCVNTRGTYSLRGIPPDEVAEFAAAHYEASWCLIKFLGFPGGHGQTKCRQSVI